MSPTLGNVFADVKKKANRLQRRKGSLGFLGLAFCAAIIWIVSGDLVNRPTPEPIRPAYQIPKQIQYSFTLQNKTNRLISRADFWTYAPVQQTAAQRLVDLKANHPYQLHVDKAGNQVLHFPVENLAPYAVRIITLRAHLLFSDQRNAVSADPPSYDLQPQPFIEADHPAIQRLARRLKTADRLQTAEKIFEWVAGNLSDAGYTRKERGALWALTHKQGDCTEYANLFVALCRAAGIAARVVGGYRCPESTVLRARDYHNWAQFYVDGTWHTADPQNRVWMQKQADYIAMRIIRPSEDNPMGEYNRFRFIGDGLQVRMN